MVDESMEPLARLRKGIEEASPPDLLREMVQVFAELLMDAEVEALCDAGYGERSPQRVNHRNGYRARRWGTRVGSMDLAIPKVRQGSYFPDWLLERRRRSERALIQVVAEAYVLGVSTRPVEKLVQTLGIAGHGAQVTCARSPTASPPAPRRGLAPSAAG